MSNVLMCLGAIQTRVRLVEQRFLQGSAPQARKAARPCFRTNGPRRPVHLRCDPRALLLHMRMLEIDPELPAVDLGSGLGMAAFALAFHFKRVVGFEIDEAVWAAAKETQQYFGIGHVNFLHQDFMLEPLDEFGFVNFFQPFAGASAEDFVVKIAAKIEQVRPGTIVNSHKLLFPGLFKPGLFEPIYPEGLIGRDWEDPENAFISEFFTFRRV